MNKIYNSILVEAAAVIMMILILNLLGVVHVS